MSEFKFSVKGQEYLTKNLTYNQAVWAHKLTLDHMQANQPKPEVVEQEQPRRLETQNLYLPTVAGKLELASQKLKRIKLTFKQDGGEVVIKKRRQGDYMVGYVEDNGKWHTVGILKADGNMTVYSGIPGVFAALDELEERFEAFVGECGRKAGACCFCRLPLTDKRSTEKGYGPVCAGHYGLPWGEK